MSIIKGLALSALTSALFLALASPVQAADVFINEIMINPEGDDTEEWIELYSPDIGWSGTDYWIDDDDKLVVDGSVQTGAADPGSNPIQGAILFQDSHFFVIELSNYLNNSSPGDHPTLFLYKDGKEEIIDDYAYDSDPGSNITLGRWPDGDRWVSILPSATKGSPNSEPPPSPSPSPSPSPEEEDSDPEASPSPTPSPAASKPPSPKPSPKASPSPQESFSPKPSLSPEEAEVLGAVASEATKTSNPYLLSFILIGLGIILLATTGIVFYNQRHGQKT